MRLRATIQSSSLDIDNTFVQVRHSTTLHFANRIGLDGATPHIGQNGNWWLGQKDTGVAAAGGIESYSSYLEFPTLGQSSHIYIDTLSNKSYRWNQSDLHYYIVGSNYDDIEIINGGDASKI